MAPHPTTHRFFWGLCLAVALLSARSARAAAPMCDENGASAIAPPPVLPVRDVRIDAGRPLGCDPPMPLLGARLGPRAAHGAAVVAHDDAREAWVPPESAGFSQGTAARSVSPFEVDCPSSPGFRPTVFRPPRT